MIEKKTYKSFDDTSLEIMMRYPSDGSKKLVGMAILFFGGGWMRGDPLQFHQYAKDLSNYGIVVAMPQYRTLRNHGTYVDTAIQDSIYAVEHLSKVANELNIEHIFVGGGSAGGHLALCSVLLDSFIPKSFTYKEKVKGLLLFNPVVNTVAFGKGRPVLEDTPYSLEQLSPAHNLSDSVPDMIIVHGKSDTTVPIDTVRSFVKEIKSNNKATCRLVEFDGKTHGFFNYRPTSLVAYYSVLGEVLNFLHEKGYIELDPLWQ